MRFLKESSHVVFLFGAGASYGSENIPIVPLGADLFDALACFAPNTWGSLPFDTSYTFKHDFEIGMSKTPPKLYSDMYIDMAKFFFRKRPSEDSLYA